MTRRSRFGSCVAALLVLASTSAARGAAVVLDDGEKIARDADHALAPSPWAGDSPIDLFAMREETVAFQVVVGPEDTPLDDVRVTLDPFVADGDAGALDVRVDSFAERFVVIARPSGNDREPGSLAFTEEAAPARGAYVGAFADALVPSAAASAGAHQRAAVWVDLSVPANARAGTYRSRMVVTRAGAPSEERTVTLRVIDRALPYPGADVVAYYDPENLTKRIGDGVETSLRQLLHAHRVSTIHEVTTVEAMAGLDDDALTGALFTPERGYVGPGAGIGDGVFAIGAYGALKDPNAAKAELVGRFARHIEELGVADRTAVFVYAVDEQCDSPRPAAWRDALAKVPASARVLVGATCGRDPKNQAASLVMVTSDSFVPASVAAARKAGKLVWVYNGIRPHAGPMMLDVPAVDLRANAWIAARYGVPRWFYWESTFWFDDNRGGKGGTSGFDPFDVAETFHNKDGDYDNGDGVLVYPGHQGDGMRDEGIAGVLPSVRLKNIRRGVEDAGYITLARAANRVAADDVVDQMIPRALADARGAVAWPERGAAWLSARRELADLIEGRPAPSRAKVRDPLAGGDASGARVAIGAAAWIGAILVAIVAALRRRAARP